MSIHKIYVCDRRSEPRRAVVTAGLTDGEYTLILLTAGIAGCRASQVPLNLTHEPSLPNPACTPFFFVVGSHRSIHFRIFSCSGCRDEAVVHPHNCARPSYNENKHTCMNAQVQIRLSFHQHNLAHCYTFATCSLTTCDHIYCQHTRRLLNTESKKSLHKERM